MLRATSRLLLQAAAAALKAVAQEGGSGKQGWEVGARQVRQEEEEEEEEARVGGGQVQHQESAGASRYHIYTDATAQRYCFE